MLFGTHHDAKQSLALLYAAHEVNITAFDTAEMYPIPENAETHGDSERILGTFLRGKGGGQTPFTPHMFIRITYYLTTLPTPSNLPPN